jgi:hypothetical protein
MKRIIRLGTIGALIGLGLVAANAQSGTNVTLGVSITLNGVAQGDANHTIRFHLGTKDVIRLIAPGASSKAKLLAVFDANGGDLSFVIRDNGTDTPAPITTEQIGDAVVTSTTTSAGVTTDKEVAIRRFVLGNGPPDFDVQGYTTSTSDNKGRKGELFADTTPRNASAKVAGTGHDSAGNAAVMQGTITLSGRKVEEVP